MAQPVNKSKRYKVAKTVAQDPSIPHVDLEGVVLHVETFGEPKNTPVIVVHGGPGWDFRELLPIQALGDEYFVVFYDQRGTGLSPRVDAEQITYESSLADLDAIIKHYGQGRKVNMIGHSWGGMLASGYIGRHAEKVNRLVLAEPGPLTGEMHASVLLKYGAGPGFLLHAIGVWIRTRFIVSTDKHEKDDSFFTQMMCSYEGKGHPTARYYCNDVIPPDSVGPWRLGYAAYKGIRGSIETGKRKTISFVEGVDAYKDEILFIVSSCNDIIGVEFQEHQMKFFPNARMAVIENVGHDMFEEDPESSLAAVRAFFSSPFQG